MNQRCETGWPWPSHSDDHRLYFHYRFLNITYIYILVYLHGKNKIRYYVQKK
jgi:hypothetical protein